MLDAHVAVMVGKRSANRFFMDDDEDEARAKELEEALLAAHECVIMLKCSEPHLTSRIAYCRSVLARLLHLTSKVMHHVSSHIHSRVMTFMPSFAQAS